MAEPDECALDLVLLFTPVGRSLHHVKINFYHRLRSRGLGNPPVPSRWQSDATCTASRCLLPIGVDTGNTFPWSHRSGDAGGTYETGGHDHEAVQ